MLLFEPQDPVQRELAPIFWAVGQALEQNREAFNQADPVNGNHGDHMVAVFELAARAAAEKPGQDVAATMEHAAQLLRAQASNGSAQVYARGLEQVARQLRRFNVGRDDLLSYVRGALAQEKDTRVNEQAQESTSETAASQGDVLKALMNGLVGWGQIESGQVPKDSPLDMGALFEFGMAYVQAKQRGGSRIEILADAAASVSPLSRSPQRYASGKLAIQALLAAMQDASTGLS